VISPGCLDLNTWLTWRCYQTYGARRVPLLRVPGLMHQLKGARIREGEKAPRENQWLLGVDTTLLARMSGDVGQGRIISPRGPRIGFHYP
jgi:hypothetical protein